MEGTDDVLTRNDMEGPDRHWQGELAATWGGDVWKIGVGRYCRELPMGPGCWRPPRGLESVWRNWAFTSRWPREWWRRAWGEASVYSIGWCLIPYNHLKRGPNYVVVKMPAPKKKPQPRPRPLKRTKIWLHYVYNYTRKICDHMGISFFCTRNFIVVARENM